MTPEPVEALELAVLKSSWCDVLYFPFLRKSTWFKQHEASVGGFGLFTTHSWNTAHVMSVSFGFYKEKIVMHMHTQNCTALLDHLSPFQWWIWHQKVLLCTDIQRSHTSCRNPTVVLLPVATCSLYCIQMIAYQAEKPTSCTTLRQNPTFHRKSQLAQNLASPRNEKSFL